MREQRVGRAVELRGRDDVAAVVGERDEGVMQRRLAGGGAQRGDAAFELGDAPLEDVGRRIGDARVAKALGFEIEQRRAVIGAVELIGDVLIDRHRDRLGRWIALKTAVDGNRLAAHVWPSARLANEICRISSRNVTFERDLRRIGRIFNNWYGLIAR